MIRCLVFLTLFVGAWGCSDDPGTPSPGPSNDAQPADASASDDAQPVDASASDDAAPEDAASEDAAVDAEAMPDASSPDADPMMGCGMTPRRDCCFDRADCTATVSGGRCVGSTGCEAMGEGVCKAPPMDPGACWDNADCPAGERCTGAIICPCNTECFAPDALGVCTAES